MQKPLPQTKLTFKILEYRKTHTLAETAKQFGLSSERVRQIQLKKYEKRCAVHNRLYFNKCAYCINEKFYKKVLSKLSHDELIDEAKEQGKNKSRDLLSSTRRVMIIKILKDKYKQSFSQIGRLFNRHYSTISHLYAN